MDNIAVENVQELFPGSEVVTRVWISAKANRQMSKLGQVNTVLTKLEHCCEENLRNFPLRLHTEGEHVFGFGIRSSTARLIGFFEDSSKDSDFLLMRAYGGKSGKRGRSIRQDAIVEEVQKIRKAKAYRKVESDHEV